MWPVLLDRLLEDSRGGDRWWSQEQERGLGCRYVLAWRSTGFSSRRDRYSSIDNWLLYHRGASGAERHIKSTSGAAAHSFRARYSSESTRGSDPAKWNRQEKKQGGRSQHLPKNSLAGYGDIHGSTEEHVTGERVKTGTGGWSGPSVGLKSSCPLVWSSIHRPPVHQALDGVFLSCLG